MSISISGNRGNSIKLIYGEKKNITYVYNVDVTNGIFELVVNDEQNGVKKVISDNELNKSEIDDYKITWLLDTTNYSIGKTYRLNLSVVFPNGTKDITDSIYVIIKEW